MLLKSLFLVISTITAQAKADSLAIQAELQLGQPAYQVDAASDLQDQLNGAAAGQCSPSGIPAPQLDGASILAVLASPVVNYTLPDQSASSSIAPIQFCNVTVKHTHPGWHDTITTTVWLPLSRWNGRFVGTGGRGYAMRYGDDTLAQEVAQGRAVVATDGGHDPTEVLVAGPWAWNSSGKVNYPLLQDFAYVALNDAAIIGKAVAASFYGQAPKYSYWNGCSTGGRQGLMLAQKYPTAYNGILSIAPAIYWSSMVPGDFWPYFLMQKYNTVIPPCVVNKITQGAIAACDGLDGVKDGIIGNPRICSFNPRTLINQTVSCGDLGNATITFNHTVIMQQIWAGPKTTVRNGFLMWYGFNQDTPFTISPNVVNTACTGSLSNCTATPFPISQDWLRYWIYQNASMDVSHLTDTQYRRAMSFSKDTFSSILDTSEPNLSAFKAAGGKIISWHGLSDQLIPPQGTEKYYNAVEFLDPKVRDFYRYFEAPGVDHCALHDNIVGPVPTTAFDDLLLWVENGTAPETLSAVSKDGSRKRELCQYPMVSVYNKSRAMDPRRSEAFDCLASFPLT